MELDLIDEYRTQQNQTTSPTMEAESIWGLPSSSPPLAAVVVVLPDDDDDDQEDPPKSDARSGLHRLSGWLDMADHVKYMM